MTYISTLNHFGLRYCLQKMSVQFFLFILCSDYASLRTKLSQESCNLLTSQALLSALGAEPGEQTSQALLSALGEEPAGQTSQALLSALGAEPAGQTSQALLSALGAEPAGQTIQALLSGLGAAPAGQTSHLLLSALGAEPAGQTCKVYKYYTLYTYVVLSSSCTSYGAIAPLAEVMMKYTHNTHSFTYTYRVTVVKFLCVPCPNPSFKIPIF